MENSSQVIEHSRLDTDSVPGRQGPGRVQRLLSWLGGIKAFFQWGNKRVSNGSGGSQAVRFSSATTSNGAAALSADGGTAVATPQRSETDIYFNRKVGARWDATKNEAGRPEGRVVPALVLGEQRYPDPSVWGPKTKKPLMEDESYRAALAYLSSIDDDDDLGGSEDAGDRRDDN